ncbi:hypothetical protein B0T10DRAFT_120680 [Thelonectria olida]|uniref:Uncharacterized protein n=1 Tax=Thelonectria olida TaxID=1576542 RepID=A0A9P9ASZ7_9HYPO|nr:hypothetical protein B0T10DRAFT_120680 [Thelonectria olida]
MANGIDLMERLFTKKKPSAVSTDATEPAAAREQQFPSPSFIRPKATRMAAREEVIVKQPSTRAPSVVDGLSPRRSLSVRAQNPAYSSDSSRLQYSPVRNSSLRDLEESPQFDDGFYDFKFPRPPTHTGGISVRSSASTTNFSTNSFELLSNRSPVSRSRRQSQAVSQRLDTPPPSDLEDDDPRCPRYFQNKKLPELPPGALLTPGPSPEISPVLDSQLNESASIDDLRRAVGEGLRRQLLHSNRDAFLRPESQSSLESSTYEASVTSSTLREPDLNDFLDLTDEDIAETDSEARLTPESGHSPVPSMLDPTTSTSPRKKSLLTLTPPYATRPAAAAAFEAARIANRYNFDLVYVVNLWPDMSVIPTAGPEEDSSSINSEFSAKAPRGLTGRLLAAYGLHNVKSPFQISALVHAKILRTQGWIEYRNQSARTDEFARGFACSFYTGQHSRTSSVASNASANPAKMRQSDRGIVFAAYRKPRADGSMAGVGCNKAQLAEVHKDAEALVEMLIDIHAANRRRQPLPYSPISDETGPMPMQRLSLH